MSHRTVIMTPENFSKAIDLARAASDCTGYGTATSAAIGTLLEETASQGDIWWTHDAGKFAVAITGNGPTSEANAAFLVDARAIVLGMVDRIDELETRLRNAEARETDLRSIVCAVNDAANTDTWSALSEIKVYRPDGSATWLPYRVLEVLRAHRKETT